MIRKILSIASLLVALSFSLFQASAQIQDNDSLSVVSIESHSMKEIDITFNEEIVLSTLRVLVEDQMTRDVLSVQAYQNGSIPTMARVVLTTDMSLNRSYKVTINTVTSVTGKTINAGVDAIREFITPDNLQAFMPTDGTTSSVNEEGYAFDSASSENSSSTQVSNSGHDMETAQKSEGNTIRGKDSQANALPATGMELWLFIGFIAVVFAGIFMKHTKRF